MSISINKLYKPLYTSDKRYYILTGGRGSLKSTTVHDFIARLTYQRGHGILFTRYTMTSAELSIIPEFKITLERLGIADDFHITKQVVTNKRTGSFIYFSGIKTSSGDQTGKLKSIAGITTWVIEEGEDFKDEKAFDDIDNSIRTTTHQNRVIWIQNPTTREHFIYKRFIEKDSRKIDVHGFDVTVSNLPEVEHIHTTYHIAESQNYLAKDWLAKVQRLKDDMQAKVDKVKSTWTRSRQELENEISKIRHSCQYYYTYIGGWLERAEGVVFDNWIEGEFDTTLPYCYGLDYGYSPDPLAMGKIAVDKKNRKIYVKEIIYETRIDDVPARLKAEGIKRSDLIVCDTNEPRTTQSIRKAGFNIEETYKEPNGVAEDIREIKTYLIVVDPKSKNFKVELNNYIWNDKKASIPIDDYNHLMDEMRYGYKRLVMPRRKGIRRRN